MRVYLNQNLLGSCPGDVVFWDSGFFLVLLSCGCGFSCGGASCRAGVCRPSSVLIHWCDGFLGILLVGLFHHIVLGFLGLHSFVRGVYVGFVCCAGILISLLSSF